MHTKTQKSNFVCRITPNVQKVIALLTDVLVTKPYEKWGKVAGSWDNYTIVFPASFGSDRRKAISSDFQKYTESVYYPLMIKLLFGENMYRSIKQYIISFKVSTIAVSKDTDYYGENKNIYHMHLDNKVGIVQHNNKCQQRKYRIVFSIPRKGTRVAEANGTDLGWTVYLKNQRKQPLKSQSEFHRYMRSRYQDLGTENGKTRPLYLIPKSDIFKAKAGEVWIHPSHIPEAASTCQPIYAEPNPCPPRILITIDLGDKITQNGKSFNVSRVPVPKIKEALARLS